jgi:hypothetical protein
MNLVLLQLCTRVCLLLMTMLLLILVVLVLVLFLVLLQFCTRLRLLLLTLLLLLLVALVLLLVLLQLCKRVCLLLLLLLLLLVLVLLLLVGVLLLAGTIAVRAWHDCCNVCPSNRDDGCGGGGGRRCVAVVVVVAQHLLTNFHPLAPLTHCHLCLLAEQGNATAGSGSSPPRRSNRDDGDTSHNTAGGSSSTTASEAAPPRATSPFVAALVRTSGGSVPLPAAQAPHLQQPPPPTVGDGDASASDADIAYHDDRHAAASPEFEELGVAARSLFSSTSNPLPPSTLTWTQRQPRVSGRSKGQTGPSRAVPTASEYASVRRDRDRDRALLLEAIRPTRQRNKVCSVVVMCSTCS